MKVFKFIIVLSFLVLSGCLSDQSANPIDQEIKDGGGITVATNPPLDESPVSQPDKGVYLNLNQAEVILLLDSSDEENFYRIEEGQLHSNLEILDANLAVNTVSSLILPKFYSISSEGDLAIFLYGSDDHNCRFLYYDYDDDDSHCVDLSGLVLNEFHRPQFDVANNLYFVGSDSLNKKMIYKWDPIAKERSAVLKIPFLSMEKWIVHANGTHIISAKQGFLHVFKMVTPDGNEINLQGMMLSYENYIHDFVFLDEKHLFYSTEAPSVSLDGMLHNNFLITLEDEGDYTVDLFLTGKNIGEFQFDGQDRLYAIKDGSKIVRVLRKKGMSEAAWGIQAVFETDEITNYYVGGDWLLVSGFKVDKTPFFSVIDLLTNEEVYTSHGQLVLDAALDDDKLYFTTRKHTRARDFFTLNAFDVLSLENEILTDLNNQPLQLDHVLEEPNHSYKSLNENYFTL